MHIDVHGTGGRCNYTINTMYIADNINMYPRDYNTIMHTRGAAVW